MSSKLCVTCHSKFSPNSGSQKYCSRSCRRVQYRKEGGHESTEAQYKLISGNWDKYFKRLCTRSFNRAGLTVQDCLELLSIQNGKCALTGVELTCRLEKGVKCKTNASIDRLDPKGAYTKENVHLVCSAINKFRIDTDLNEFIDWCRKVAKHAIRE